MPPREIPLFPLKLVLFPGGYLTLRIFEQRYLDMVRESAGEDRGFGIVLVVDSGIPEKPAWHSRIGTLALIRDFFTHDDGLLGLTVQGGPRFSILHTRVRDNGLLIGHVDWFPDEPPTEVPDEYLLLADLARQLAEVASEDNPALAEPRLEDASWVGCRLAEMLPLDDTHKQRLLECVDPIERLQLLMEAVPQVTEG